MLGMHLAMLVCTPVPDPITIGSEVTELLFSFYFFTWKWKKGEDAQRNDTQLCEGEVYSNYVN